MRIKILVLISVIILAMTACDSKERVKAPEPGQPAVAPRQMASDGHNVVVEEVVQAKSYTYLRVTEGSKEYWIATAKQPYEAGMSLSYGQGMEMKDFASKELDRVFESIWFVGQMSGASSVAQSSSMGSSSGSQSMSRPQNISVQKVAGGVTVAELYADMAAYEGKTISIRGEVTKFNSKIMDRNWVHLQDGTKAGDNFDLTITTRAPVKVGETVVFKGVVTLNKDFGAGYKYDLIVEEAVLVNEG
ncbi:MAG: GW dipeptide domain-containing protein [Candidatus Marinimicrobia bacterium]|nr:GW dipeptide domain-containing protein [Candidatus Neomarinimicrobiota bacterium]